MRSKEKNEDAAPPFGESNDVLLTNLVQRGQLTRRQASRAIEWQRNRGVSSREAVEQMRLVKKEEMLKALSERYSYPIIENAPENRKFSRELVTGHDPFGAAAESIRSIRSAIAATVLAEGTRSMVVMAPHGKAGATYLVTNLAVAFAQMSIPTLLVDANLRRPRAGEIFGIPPNSEGLSELLLRKDAELSFVKTNVIPNLSVLPAGSIPPNPQELLSSPEFLALTNTFNDQFGVVLYDAATGTEYADALVVGSRVNAAILVGRRHKTSYHEVSALVKRLESIRCALVGTVFNQF
jgi:capsular exopolysaccharide synthesis family protein